MQYGCGQEYYRRSDNQRSPHQVHLLEIAACQFHALGCPHQRHAVQTRTSLNLPPHASRNLAYSILRFCYPLSRSQYSTLVRTVEFLSVSDLHARPHEWHCESIQIRSAVGNQGSGAVYLLMKNDMLSVDIPGAGTEISLSVNESIYRYPYLFHHSHSCGVQRSVAPGISLCGRTTNSPSRAVRILLS